MVMELLLRVFLGAEQQGCDTLPIKAWGVSTFGDRS